MGFWERLEAWLLDLQRDRARLARYLAVAYWLSLLMVLLGGIVIVLTLTGAWRP